MFLNKPLKVIPVSLLDKPTGVYLHLTKIKVRDSFLCLH